MSITSLTFNSKVFILFFNFINIIVNIISYENSTKEPLSLSLD